MTTNAEQYYSQNYSDSQRAGLQGLGNSLVDRQVERYIKRREGDRLLEIGASSGEHMAFVPTVPKWKEYVCLDLLPGLTNPELARSLTERDVCKFVSGDASNMPFAESHFDISLSTCVLAHVRDPESVFSELRRVTRIGGQVIVAMPTDPGILNRAVKRLVTYRSMRRAGVSNPRLNYAREHINSIGNLLTIANHVFRNDKVQIKNFPLPLPTWNFNLIVTIVVTKR